VFLDFVKEKDGMIMVRGAFLAEFLNDLVLPLFDHIVIV
jgi:hypothetical protein